MLGGEGWERFTVTMPDRRVAFELRLRVCDNGYQGIIHHTCSPVPICLTGTRDTTALEWFAEMLAGIEHHKMLAANSGD